MRKAFVVVAVLGSACGSSKEPVPAPGSAEPAPAPAKAEPPPPPVAPPADKPEDPAAEAAAALAAIEPAAEPCKGTACAKLGMPFLKTEAEKAVGYFKKGCDTGDGISCGMLGLAFKEGLGVAKSLAATLVLNTRSCDLGYFKGCYNLGLMLYNGDGVASDEAKGLAVLEKACAGDAYRACGSLADLYLTTDKAKATTLAKRGCDNNDPMSCEVLEKIR